jgi:hypothetical protein
VTYQPWMPTEGNEKAITHRELRLPPDCQMHGNMQALRDAILATMLLSEHLAPMDANPYFALERIRLRMNERANMMRRRRLLESQARPETIEQCKETARKLLHIEITSQRNQAVKRFQPSMDRSISEAAYKAYWNKAKKEREGTVDDGELEVFELRDVQASGPVRQTP